MLLPQWLVDSFTSFHKIHPFPLALVQGMLILRFRVIITVPIRMAQLPILGLDFLQVVLEITSKTELICIVEGLCIQSREEKQ